MGLVVVELAAAVVVTGALEVVGAIVVDAVEGVPLVVVTGALEVVGGIVVDAVEGVPLVVVTGALVVVVGAAVVFVVTGALVVVAGATVVSDAATFRGKQISKVNSIGCTILPETYVEYQSAAACR